MTYFCLDLIVLHYLLSKYLRDKIKVEIPFLQAPRLCFIPNVAFCYSTQKI